MFLVDMVGRVVHTWQADPEMSSEAWFLRRLPTGNWMSLVQRKSRPDEPSAESEALGGGGDRGYEDEILEYDWEGAIVWRYACPEGWRFHHDMARLRNGHTLILAEKKAEIPAISAKPITENFITEVDPDGNIVWDWHSTEHFDEFGYPAEARRLMHERGGDIFHTNTLSPLPGNELESTDKRFAKDNILLCQRSTNVIYILDKQTKEVVWTWGDGKDQLVGPHQPVMLANGDILVYDNGGHAGYPTKCRFYTRLVEMNPLSREIVWEYAHEPYKVKPTSKFFSSSWGSVQRLPNGNTFSLDCHKGRLFEVTPSGEIVWEYISPFSWGRGTQVVESGIYRAYRYGYDEVAEPDPVFKNTDGHVDVQPLPRSLPEGLGLPANDLP